MSLDPQARQGIEFRTLPLTNREADALHAELDDADDVLSVYLAGDDGDRWDGAILPSDPSDLALLEIAERLRANRRISRESVAVGRFPDHAV